MKRITLKKLTLENWRAKNVSFEFSEGVTEIRAKNGVGKSTLFNAWVWLLVGTDTNDRANYDLFDTRTELSKETPTACVEAILDVDGSELRLRRTAKSQWLRKRGKETWEKANSDKYQFFVDDVEYPAKQYQDAVSALFSGQSADIVKMCCNPLQSNNLEWKELRKRFESIIGEITQEDYKGDYTLIKDSINRHGFDTAKQGQMNRVNDLKNSLKRINLEIEAKERTLPNLNQCDEAQQQLEEKKQRIAEIDAEITGIGEANRPYIEKRNAEDAAIQAQLQKIVNARYEYEREQGAEARRIENEYREKLSQYREIEDYNNSLDSKRRELDREIASTNADIEFLNESREELHKRKDEVLAREFKYNDTCPTCGQPLPYDEQKISEARLRFYDAKENEKNAIIAQGKSVRARRDDRIAHLEDLKARKESLTPKETFDIAPYKQAAENASVSVLPFEQTPTYEALRKELNELQSNRTEIPKKIDTSDIEAEKKRLLNEVQTLAEITAYRGIHARISEDIAVKKQEQTATASQLASEEHKLFKYVEYEREHASIISTRVNKYLKIANVKMLTVNKSGEFTDCCVITCDGVGNTMNRASVIRTGVDVANAFQRYFEIQAPLFIDDVDCIADELIPQTEGQQIRLRFDENYETLTIV
jgi:hypothetical protein